MYRKFRVELSEDYKQTFFYRIESNHLGGESYEFENFE